MGKWVKFRTVHRVDVPGHAHYLTFSCWQGQALLSKDRTRRWLLESLEAARGEQGFDLWAYVIMPEHAHLLILPHPSSQISRILRAIKEPLAKRAVAWIRHSVPDFLARMEDRQPNGRCCHRFWQPGGGYDRNIWTAKELHEKIRYVHNNPVRRGLVERAEDWLWSSCRAWEQGTDEPIAIDRETLPPLER